MEDARYPIGKFEYSGDASPAEREVWMNEIANLPAQLRSISEGLTEEQLSTPYREGGWTLRQVIHHVADSHMNAYIRFKLALTEPCPTIRPYAEDSWAELEDTSLEPIETSLTLLDALHRRWVTLLRSMSDEQFQLSFYHPEAKTTLKLGTTLRNYAWHGRHHLAHILNLKKRMDW